MDWGSFAAPSTFPAAGKDGNITWAGRLYAGSWVADRLADVKNTLSGGAKTSNIVYFKDYTNDKSCLKDTMYQTPVKKRRNL